MPKRGYDCKEMAGGSTSWGDVADSLLRFIDRGQFMLCVDLDHTLWPISCFEMTEGPYVALPTYGNTDGKGVTYTSRRDKQRNTLQLHEDVFAILDWCYSRHIQLSICSKSQVDSAARGILEALDMWKFFKFPQIYNKRKSHHFKQLKECTDFEYDNFLFFDDDVHNVELCTSIGVICEVVDKTHGLTKEVFLRGLTTFALRNHSSNIPSPVPVKSHRTICATIELPKSISDNDANSCTSSDFSSTDTDTEGKNPRRMAGMINNLVISTCPTPAASSLASSPVPASLVFFSSDSSSEQSSIRDVDGSLEQQEKVPLLELPGPAATCTKDLCLSSEADISLL